MTRNRRFRSSRTVTGTVGAVALAGLLALPGCGAGQISQTANQGAAVNGSGGQLGSIAIRDLKIGYPAAPAAADALYQRGGAAPLEFTMLNQGTAADRLVRVSSPVANAVTIGGDSVLPPTVPLVGGAEPGSLVPGARPLAIELSGLTGPIRAGLLVPVTFTFERAGSRTIQVPVDAPGEATEPERVDSEAEGAEPAAPEAPPASGEPAPAPAAPEGGR